MHIKARAARSAQHRPAKTREPSSEGQWVAGQGAQESFSPARRQPPHSRTATPCVSTGRSPPPLVALALLRLVRRDERVEVVGRREPKRKRARCLERRRGRHKRARRRRAPPRCDPRPSAPGGPIARRRGPSRRTRAPGLCVARPPRDYSQGRSSEQAPSNARRLKHRARSTRARRPLLRGVARRASFARRPTSKWHFIPIHSIPFSIPFHSIPFSIPFHSIPLHPSRAGQPSHLEVRGPRADDRLDARVGLEAHERRVTVGYSSVITRPDPYVTRHS